MIPQMPSAPRSFQISMKPAPSNETFRMASFKNVSGKTLQNGWSQFGKFVMEKNVPDKRNCGSVIRFAIGGTALSFFAKPLTTNPNPMKIINPIAHSSIMVRNVTIPCIMVNPKAK